MLLLLLLLLQKKTSTRWENVKYISRFRWQYCARYRCRVAAIPSASSLEKRRLYSSVNRRWELSRGRGHGGQFDVLCSSLLLYLCKGNSVMCVNLVLIALAVADRRLALKHVKEAVHCLLQGIGGDVGPRCGRKGKVRRVGGRQRWGI